MVHNHPAKETDRHHTEKHDDLLSKSNNYKQGKKKGKALTTPWNYENA